MDWWPESPRTLRLWREGRVVAMCGMLLLSLAGGAVGGATAQPTQWGPSSQSAVHTPSPTVMPQLVDAATSDLPGSGTAADPYRISNVSELQAMEDDLNASYVLVNDIDASATTNANNGQGFDPVDDFAGRFDGQGHTIRGLVINRPTAADVGLFGTTVEATVTDVRLTNISVTGSDDIGGLVGDNEGGEIKNVSVNGTVTGNSIVGGLAGANEEGIIKSGSASVTVNGSDAVGGLVGVNNGGTIEAGLTSGSVTGGARVGGLVGVNTGTVATASATASVNGSGGASGGSSTSVGGLIGTNSGGSVENVSASGTVTGSFSVGGLVGLNAVRPDSENETVTNAWASGSVNGEQQVGGLVGGNEPRGTIQDTFAVGSVTGSSEVGGLVGDNLGSVSDSYWDQDATGQPTSAGEGATGLTTTMMQGDAAQQNMAGLAFGTTWQTVSGEYPESIALTELTNGESQTALQRFDRNENDRIDISEVRRGINAFASGELRLQEVRQLINYWANGTLVRDS